MSIHSARRSGLSWPARLARGLAGYEKQQLARAGSIEALEQERLAARVRGFERRNFLFDLEEPKPRAVQGLMRVPTDTKHQAEVREWAEKMIKGMEEKKALLLDLEGPSPRNKRQPRWIWAHAHVQDEEGYSGTWMNHLFRVGGRPKRGVMWGMQVTGERDGWFSSLCGAKTGALNNPESLGAFCRECRRRRREKLGGPSAWSVILEEPEV